MHNYCNFICIQIQRDNFSINKLKNLLILNLLSVDLFEKSFLFDIKFYIMIKFES